MRRLLDSLRELWCVNVHRSAMWPMHGRYRCAVCLREYRVVFEGSPEPAVERHRNVLPISVGAEGRSVARRRSPDLAIVRETATHAPNSIPA